MASLIGSAPTSEAEVVAGAAIEPLSLSDAKDHLRVDHGDDDVLIAGLIRAARQQVETFTRQSLITRTLRWSWDSFPPSLVIPAWPVQSIEAVVYTDDAGAEQTLAIDAWTLLQRRPREIAPAYGRTWPSVRRHYGAVRVTAVVGHGATPLAAPPALVHAVKIVLSGLYDVREPTMIGVAVAEVPGLASARALMTPHVVWF